MKASKQNSNSPLASNATEVPDNKGEVKKIPTPPPNNDTNDNITCINEIIDEEATVSSESDESIFIGRRLRKASSKPLSTKRKHPVIESESDDEMNNEEEEEEDEDEDDDDEDEDYEEEEEEITAGSPKKKRNTPAEISISFTTSGSDASERLIPKRFNMKKEPSIVQKFFKLMTDPPEDDGIDNQIEQFKALTTEKQEQLVSSLDNKQITQQENLMFKILSMNVSSEIKAIALAKYNSLQSMDHGSGEYFKHKSWLEKFSSLPLGIYKDLPVKMDDGIEQCNMFMSNAYEILSNAIYGQHESKLQILQFIATRIANPSARGASLLLIGPPGIGKTSLIKNGIAKALSWPFQFISLGGDSDASTYSGHQLVYEGSHAGKIANSLIAAKSMSMILMFDELDKISSTSKGEEVQNLMIHITDVVQNADFEDKYLAGIPLDLSRTMFVFSGNDITKIDKVLLDRMTVIQLKGYDKMEKLHIAENFLLPSALKDVNLVDNLTIQTDVLEYIICKYAGNEEGVRELKRCIEQITQKVNMLRIFNSKTLPFYIENFTLPFNVKKHHVDLFLKKKEDEINPSLIGMYI